MCVWNFPSCLELLSYSYQIFTLAINDTWTLEYIAFIKVVITNVIYHWGEEWQLLCWFWELSFTSHSIRIRIWTVCTWNWKPSSVQFNFLVMASKQPSGNMVELSTFLTWGKKKVIRHKTLSLPNGKIMVNHIWCKVCAAHKNDIVNLLKGNAEQSAQAFIQGMNVVTKHQVWIFSVLFLHKTIKFQNCLISVWNRSSQLKFPLTLNTILKTLQSTHSFCWKSVFYLLNGFFLEFQYWCKIQYLVVLKVSINLTTKNPTS